jgi:hypothetical protein
MMFREIMSITVAALNYLPSLERWDRRLFYVHVEALRRADLPFK